MRGLVARARCSTEAQIVKTVRLRLTWGQHLKGLV